jgi:hypothetical protein
MNINHGGMGRNTRDVGLSSHGAAGKGDAPRDVDKQTFDENYDEIDWTESRPSTKKRIIKVNDGRTITVY